MRDKKLAKLQAAYARADGELRAYINELFPEGTKVRCTLTGNHYTVKKGSLYADQVFTNLGHAGAWHLERIES